MRPGLHSIAAFRRIGGLGALALVCSTWTSLAQNSPPDSLPQTVGFNRDIRPILSDKCFKCHGPSSTSRRANLRLDSEDAVLKDATRNTPAEGTMKVIAPGDPEHSTVMQRITATDLKRRMPFGGEPLSDRQVKLIGRWIEQGAKYEPLWSFIRPVRPELPRVANSAWPKNGIDWFVLDRLEHEGLKPSPEANRATLIRRVSLDLTGLPPTLAEIDAFLGDRSPDAYEKVVDRLLASPRYGERMAAPWMAAARFADTSGYNLDPDRDMHRWRDWVIDAFNRNLPFDRFTIEQLAGDLLPNATLEQKIATGFNRNHRQMSENGANPDEYFVENVLDRASTVGTVWLGLTFGCARCHDHKFDPITQKETYQLYAYFNSIAESGNGQRDGSNAPPLVRAPTPEQQARLKELEGRIRAAEQQLAALGPEIERAQRAWEKSVGDSSPIVGSLEDGLVGYFPLASDAERRFDGSRFVDGGTAGHFGWKTPWSMAAWIEPTAPSGPIVTARSALDVPRGTGYRLVLEEGKVRLDFVPGRWMDNAAHVVTEEPVALNGRHHVAATYDGSRQVEGIHIYVDGRPQKLKVLFNGIGDPGRELPDPVRIGAGGGPARFLGSISDVRTYDVDLTPDQVAAIAESASLVEIAAIPPAQRTKAQGDKIDAYFLAHQATALVEQPRSRYREQAAAGGDVAGGESAEKAPLPLEKVLAALKEARKQKAEFEQTLPTVMVMQELPEPREAHVLIRGAFDHPGDKVEPATPAWLPPLPPGAPNNRLGLAMWLVDPSNPLTARVAVNRYWEMFFGVGLVKTVDNFGSQGDQPSHPDLLDWLATEFLRLKWDEKAMQKVIVTSATYRQSSAIRPDLLQKDPENRLLARGPRYRLPAEMVRDEILAISGLLSARIGGPSVKPYQPAGVWDSTENHKYVQDHGESLYRRSLYTFWRRSAPPPSLAMFDVAERDNSAVGTSRTDTPLQALNLLNDVTYVEAARILAERMLTEGGNTDTDRVAFAFRLATARPPSETEFGVLLKSLRTFRERYRADGAAALKLVSQGEHPRSETLNVAELAANAVVARLIFNLDQVITKE
jgi:hypothetical protein